MKESFAGHWGMPDVSVVELNRLGEEDRMRAEQGLVGVPIT